MTLSARLLAWFAPAAVLAVSFAIAAADVPAKIHDDATGNPEAVTHKDGIYYSKGDIPTFHIDKNGTVDWNVFSGYIRYTANCMRCHGPDGMGSSYGPALVGSLQNITYQQFISTVVGGRKNVNTANDLVMPEFGNDPNVTCYLNSIWIYLRARSDGALGRGRPDKHEPKPAAVAKAEDECMG